MQCIYVFWKEYWWLLSVLWATCLLDYLFLSVGIHHNFCWSSLFHHEGGSAAPGLQLQQWWSSWEHCKSMMLKIRLRWNFQAQHGNQLLLSLSFQTAISLLGSSYSCLAVTQKQIFPSFGKFECNHLAALQLSQVNKIVFHLLGTTFSSRQLKNHSNTAQTCVLLPSVFCFARFRM